MLPFLKWRLHRGNARGVASVLQHAVEVALELAGNEGEALDHAGALYSAFSPIDNARNTSRAACNFYFCVLFFPAGASVRSFAPGRPLHFFLSLFPPSLSFSLPFLVFLS